MSLLYVQARATIQSMNQFAPPENETNQDGTTADSPNRTASLIGFFLVSGVLIAWATPPVALITGMFFTLLVGNPLPQWGPKLAKRL